MRNLALIKSRGLTARTDGVSGAGGPRAGVGRGSWDRGTVLEGGGGEGGVGGALGSTVIKCDMGISLKRHEAKRIGP